MLVTAITRLGLYIQVARLMAERLRELGDFKGWVNLGYILG